MEGRKDHIKLWRRALVCGFPHAKAVTPEFGTAFGTSETTVGE
jgi:hypothetical protein